MKEQPRVSRISIGRLKNLGNYEHIRYEIAVEVPEGASAAAACKNLEAIIEALKPSRKYSEYDVQRAKTTVQTYNTKLKAVMEMGDLEEKERELKDLRDRHQEALKLLTILEAEEKRRGSARDALEKIGGSEIFKDCKNDWQDDDEF